MAIPLNAATGFAGAVQGYQEQKRYQTGIANQQAQERSSYIERLRAQYPGLTDDQYNFIYDKDRGGKPASNADFYGTAAPNTLKPGSAITSPQQAAPSLPPGPSYSVPVAPWDASGGTGTLPPVRDAGMTPADVAPIRDPGMSPTAQGVIRTRDPGMALPTFPGSGPSAFPSVDAAPQLPQAPRSVLYSQPPLPSPPQNAPIAPIVPTRPAPVAAQSAPPVPTAPQSADIVAPTLPQMPYAQSTIPGGPPSLPSRPSSTSQIPGISPQLSAQISSNGQSPDNGIPWNKRSFADIAGPSEQQRIASVRQAPQMAHWENMRVAAEQKYGADVTSKFYKAIEPYSQNPDAQVQAANIFDSQNGTHFSDGFQGGTGATDKATTAAGNLENRVTRTGNAEDDAAAKEYQQYKTQFPNANDADIVRTVADAHPNAKGFASIYKSVLAGDQNAPNLGPSNASQRVTNQTDTTGLKLSDGETKQLKTLSTAAPDQQARIANQWNNSPTVRAHPEMAIPVPNGKDVPFYKPGADTQAIIDARNSDALLNGVKSNFYPQLIQSVIGKDNAEAYVAQARALAIPQQVQNEITKTAQSRLYQDGLLRLGQGRLNAMMRSGDYRTLYGQEAKLVAQQDALNQQKRIAMEKIADPKELKRFNDGTDAQISLLQQSIDAVRSQRNDLETQYENAPTTASVKPLPSNGEIAPKAGKGTYRDGDTKTIGGVTKTVNEWRAYYQQTTGKPAPF